MLTEDETMHVIRTVELQQQAEADALDDALTRAIDAICRRAGAQNDYPSPRDVRRWLAEQGLMVRPMMGARSDVFTVSM